MHEAWRMGPSQAAELHYFRRGARGEDGGLLSVGTEVMGYMAG